MSHHFHEGSFGGKFLEAPVTSLFLIGRLAYQPKGEENQAFIAQRMLFLETDAVCRRGWIEAFPNLAYHAAIQFSPFTDS